MKEFRDYESVLAYSSNGSPELDSDSKLNRIFVGTLGRVSVNDRENFAELKTYPIRIKQGDNPSWFNGSPYDLYPETDGRISFVFQQIKNGQPQIRWATALKRGGVSGSSLTEKLNISSATNPRFGPSPGPSETTLAFLKEDGRISYWHVHDNNRNSEDLFIPSMNQPIKDFDWGVDFRRGGGGGMMDRMRNMMPGGNNRGGGNQMDDRMMEEGRKMMQEQEEMQRRMMDEQRKMEEEQRERDRQREEEDRRRQDQERDRRQQEDEQRFKMEEERRALELKSEQDRLSIEDERRMRELEQRREEMEMEREMREEQMRMDEERREMEREAEEERMAQQARMMEEQRRMMREEAAARGGTGPGPDGGGPGGPDFYVRGASEDQYNCMVQTLGPPVVEQFNFRDPRPDEYEKLHNNGCEGVAELFGQEVYGEDDRGFFGKPKMGGIKTGGPGEMMQDPTMLAIAGLVVTVGATLLQMARGK